MLGAIGGVWLAPSSLRSESDNARSIHSTHLMLPADDLQELIATAGHELVLVAPFVKVATLERLLDHAPAEVVLTCITRWQPEEVAAGVSDLEVFDVLDNRAGATLLLWPRLHAKYFRADGRCLIGSANITSRALGWVQPSNVELLIEAPAAHPRLLTFEKRARVEAQPATTHLRMLVAKAAGEINREREKPTAVSMVGDGSEPLPSDRNDITDLDIDVWLPSLRQPSDLHRAYSGHVEELSTMSSIAARRDLSALDPPGGLSAETFSKVVAAILLQMPMIARIDAYTASTRRFGAVRDLIVAKTGMEGQHAGIAWQTTMRWLLYFLPDRYQRTRPAHSELFTRVQDSGH